MHLFMKIFYWKFKNIENENNHKAYISFITMYHLKIITQMFLKNM